MRLQERFCGCQVTGNVLQILKQAFFFVPGKTLCKCIPHPLLSSPWPRFPHCRAASFKGNASSFLTASESSTAAAATRTSRGMCRLLSSGLWSFVFPQSCRRRDTRAGQLTSWLVVLKPTRSARDFLMSQSQAERWKAASRGGKKKGSWAEDTTRTGRSRWKEGRHRWRSGSCSSSVDQKTMEQSTKRSFHFILSEGRGLNQERRPNYSMLKCCKRVLHLKSLSWKHIFHEEMAWCAFSVWKLGLISFLLLSSSKFALPKECLSSCERTVLFCFVFCFLQCLLVFFGTRHKNIFH